MEQFVSGLGHGRIDGCLPEVLPREYAPANRQAGHDGDDRPPNSLGAQHDEFLRPTESCKPIMVVSPSGLNSFSYHATASNLLARTTGSKRAPTCVAFPS